MRLINIHINVCCFIINASTVLVMWQQKVLNLLDRGAAGGAEVESGVGQGSIAWQGLEVNPFLCVNMLPN